MSRNIPVLDAKIRLAILIESRMDRDIDYYLNRISIIKVDRSNKWSPISANGAPHKPFLLLSILDLYGEGRITSNFINISYELGELFNNYWTKVMPLGTRGNLAYPFFHLQSSAFWHLIPQSGKDTALASARTISSLRELQSLVLGAQLDEELHNLLLTPNSREKIRNCLLAKFFSEDARTVLLKSARLNLSCYEFAARLIDLARLGIVATAEIEERRDGVRKQGFRKAIVTIYEHRCALCGVRMMTSSGRSAVDAAHIVPWSESRCDEIQNGMALCRLCHWSFDEGMVFVSNDFKVVLSPEIKNEINLPGHLMTLARRAIMGPSEDALWPSREYLRKHRERFDHA